MVSSSSNPEHDDLEEVLPGRSSAGAGVGPLCPACGGLNREQSLFCAHCGEALGRYCYQCGRAIAPELDVCDLCSANAPRSAFQEGRCQSCGHQNDVTAERCLKCGARLLVNCARCGSVHPASFNFCPRCGFQQSRLVTELVLGDIEGEKQEEPPLRAPRSRASLALMVGLVLVSVALMIHILLQIGAA